jgi:hypothetical protein
MTPDVAAAAEVLVRARALARQGYPAAPRGGRSYRPAPARPTPGAGTAPRPTPRAQALPAPGVAPAAAPPSSRGQLSLGGLR